MGSSHLGSILTEWADKQPVQPVTDAALGRALEVTRQTVANWRAGLSRLPAPHQLRKVATLTGRSYQDVLEAALLDAGYLIREGVSDDWRDYDLAADRGPKQPGFDKQ